MFFDLARFGDCVVTSAITSQLKSSATFVVYYTKCPGIAKYLTGVDVVVDSDAWNLRERGLDFNLTIYPLDKGYPKYKPDLHMIDEMCRMVNLPVAPMSLQSFPKLRDDKYITLQKTAGWSSLKEYDYWDKVEFPLPVVELDTSLTWAETLAYIQHASLHCGLDSVGNHIAGAYKTPAIILFGSTTPVLSGYNTAINLRECPCNDVCFIENRYTNGNRCYDKCALDPIKGINLIDPKKISQTIYSVLDKAEHQD